jgi:hypothetical protein
MQVAALITVFAATFAALSWLLTDQAQVAVVAFICGMFAGLGLAWVCWPWEENPSNTK